MQEGLCLGKGNYAAPQFIAVSDGGDSEKGENDFTPLRNLFNEWYARDTSKKIHAVVKAKGTSGKRLNNLPPYGYIYDENKDRATGRATARKPLVNAFIEKMIVHEADKSTGKRVQKIENVYNFIGNIKIPQEPPKMELVELPKGPSRKRNAKQVVYFYCDTKKSLPPGHPGEGDPSCLRLLLNAICRHKVLLIPGYILRSRHCIQVVGDQLIFLQIIIFPGIRLRHLAELLAPVGCG